MIKETKELLVGVNELSIVLIKQLKDGVQFNDAVELWLKIQADADFRTKLSLAIENVKAVPTEFKESTLQDKLDLIQIELNYIPLIVTSLNDGKTLTSPSVVGIEDVKNLMKAVKVLTLYIIDRSRDGVGVDDLLNLFIKLQTDAEFLHTLTQAFVGIKNIGAEVKDLQLQEVIELASLMISYVPVISDSFKPKA